MNFKKNVVSLIGVFIRHFYVKKNITIFYLPQVNGAPPSVLTIAKIIDLTPSQPDTLAFTSRTNIGGLE